MELVHKKHEGLLLSLINSSEGILLSAIENAAKDLSEMHRQDIALVFWATFDLPVPPQVQSYYDELCESLGKSNAIVAIKNAHKSPSGSHGNNQLFFEDSVQIKNHARDLQSRMEKVETKRLVEKNVEGRQFSDDEEFLENQEYSEEEEFSEE